MQLAATRYVSYVRERRRARAEDSWRAVHRVAARKEGFVARGFRDAVGSARRFIDGGGLTQTLANRSTDPHAVDRAAQEAGDLFRARLEPRLKSAYAAVLKQTGDLELRLATRGASLELLSAFRAAAPRRDTPEGRFDIQNAEAVRWIREHAATQVTGITQEVVLAIRKVLSDAYRKGLPNTSILKRLRSIIGLTERQSDAVVNAADQIAAQAPGTLITLGNRRYRIPRGGPDATWMDKVLNRYGAKLLNDRAKMIARTETIKAANEGQRQAWVQAVGRGLLDEDRVQRVWIVTPDDRLCPECRKLNGQRTDIDGSFDSDEYGELDGPPAHPQCRCAQGLVPRGKALPKAATAGVHKFATSQIELPEEAATYVRHFGSLIPESVVAGDGREMLPHVTVLYGLGDDPAPIEDLTRDFGPVELKLGEIGYFEGVEDGTCDVVFVKIDSPDLKELRDVLSALPHKPSDKEYVPHATISYVKLGMGEFLSKTLNLTAQPKTIQVNALSYRARTGAKRSFSLAGPRAAGDVAGHAFHGNQWTVLHGTAASNLDTILKEGLKASNSGKVWKGLTKDGKVYVTTSKAIAQEFAQYAVSRKGGKDFIKSGGHLAILKIQVPKSEVSRLIGDRNNEVKDSFEFKGDIPASWIKGVTIKTYFGGKTIERKNLAAGDETYFVPIELLGEDEK